MNSKAILNALMTARNIAHIFDHAEFTRSEFNQVHQKYEASLDTLLNYGFIRVKRKERFTVHLSKPIVKYRYQYLTDEGKEVFNLSHHDYCYNKAYCNLVNNVYNNGYPLIYRGMVASKTNEVTGIRYYYVFDYNTFNQTCNRLVDKAQACQRNTKKRITVLENRLGRLDKIEKVAKRGII